MIETDRIKDAIRKAENRVANLETAKALARETIAASDREILIITRNIKRMNVELIAAISEEAHQRKLNRIIEADTDSRNYERVFISNAKRMLNSDTYKALVAASREAIKA